MRQPNFEIFAEFNTPPEFKIPDLQVFYSHSPDNIWESAYVRERERREALENSTAAEHGDDRLRMRTASVAREDVLVCTKPVESIKKDGPSNEEVLS